jgi:phospholipase D1/2
VPSTGRKERLSGEQSPQQELRAEEASSRPPSAVTEKSCGSPAHEKAGTSTPIEKEKVNGSAINDKGKKTKGEPPFTKQEREEMETLLGDLCGHLGWSSWFSAVLQSLINCIPVVYPTRFLEGEDAVNNFLFTTDRLLPLPIYN